MSDNRKYYYLKLKEGFFDGDEIKVLQGMENGYLYSDILLKLYLKSLKSDGRLMFKEHIPYDLKMIAVVTNHNIVIVEKALKILRDLGLIFVLDNGAIYMADIQNFIGESSTEGDRKREYRNRIATEKKLLNVGQTTGQLSDHASDVHPPEIRDRDRVKDIEINNGASEDDAALVPAEKGDEPGARPRAGKDEYSEDFQQFWNAYPRCKEKKRAYRQWGARLKEKPPVLAADMIAAAQNYARECARLHTDEKFIKHPATFIGPDKPFVEYLGGGDDGGGGKEPVGAPDCKNGGQQRPSRARSAGDV